MGHSGTTLISGKSVPIIVDDHDVVAAMDLCGAHTVAMAGAELLGVKALRRLIWDLGPEEVDLMASTGVMDTALSRLVMRPTAGMPLIHIEKPQYEEVKTFQMRLFGIVFSPCALAAAVPVMAAVAAVATRMTSTGPRVLLR